MWLQESMYNPSIAIAWLSDNRGDAHDKTKDTERSRRQSLENFTVSEIVIFFIRVKHEVVRDPHRIVSRYSVHWSR